MEKGKVEYKKGLWTGEEDEILMDYVKIHGKGQWNSISKRTGLKRCGKSCRLRWMNYLNPSIKRGHFSEEEEDLIIRLHKLLGNRWSLIAGRVPGRTDNQIKNYWNTHLSKKLGIKKEARRIAVLTSSSSNDNNDDGNKKSGSGEFDQNLSCKFPIKFPAGDWNDPGPDIDAQTHQETIAIGSEGYVTNSSLWVSEFDGLMGESEANPACFMELICGNSFNLDWNHL